MNSLFKILLLEDDPADVRLVTDQLRDEGLHAEITHVSDSAGFLAAAGRDDFDLVLADYKLPGFDGLQALAIWRERQQEKPFLFVTGSMGEDLAVESLKTGATDYILKDNLSRLVPAIRRAVAETEELAKRRRTEEALCESEERFRVALKGSAFTLSQSDKELRYRWIHNPHPDFDSSNGIGKRDDELDDSKAAHALLAHKRRVVASGLGARAEITFERSDGAKTYDFTIEPLQGADGAIIGVTSAAFDITERKQMEEELRHNVEKLAFANNELESFNNSVSHDLRNPLQAIVSCIAVLSKNKKNMNEDEQKAIDYIRQMTKRMSQVLKDLLSLSYISRQEMRSAAVALSTIAQDLVNEIKANDPHHEVEVIIMPGLTVSADESLVSILLENLLRNAYKFSSKCTRARIEFGATCIGGQPVYFVRDNGVGFDRALAGRMFEPFMRFHTQEDFPGSGIGLSIVKRIVERYDGAIWAESEPGKGATFYFTLSYSKDPAPARKKAGFLAGTH